MIRENSVMIKSNVLCLSNQKGKRVKCRYVCRPQAEHFDILSDDARTSAISPFSTGNTLFGKIWSLKSKLSF